MGVRLTHRSIVLALLFVLLASACTVSSEVDGSQVSTTSGGADDQPTPLPIDPEPSAAPAAAPEPQLADPDPTAIPAPEPTAAPEAEPTAPPTPEPSNQAPVPPAPVAGEDTLGSALGAGIAAAWGETWLVRGEGADCWNDNAAAGIANTSADWLTDGDDPRLEQFIVAVIEFCGIEDEVISSTLALIYGLSPAEAICVTFSLDPAETTIATAAAVGNQGNPGQDSLVMQTLIDDSGCTDAITDAPTDGRVPPVPPPPADDRLGDDVGQLTSEVIGSSLGLSGADLTCWNENAGIGFSNVSAEWLTNGGADDRFEQFLAQVVIYCDILVQTLGFRLNQEFDVPQQQATCIAESLSPAEQIIGAAVAIGDQGNPGQLATTIQSFIDSYPDCASG